MGEVKKQDVERNTSLLDSCVKHTFHLRIRKLHSVPHASVPNSAALFPIPLRPAAVRLSSGSLVEGLSQPSVFGSEALRRGDGVAVELSGKLGLAVVAAAVEDRDGDAVLDHGTQQNLVAALDVFQ